MGSYVPEFRIIDKSHVGLLTEFFQSLKSFGEDKFFHPHPFNAEEAERLAQYDGDDLYYILVEGDHIIGYGMLRGWDEGYKVPSLGIVIHPTERNKGLGKLFINFLHVVAERKGVRHIRLKVYRENTVALNFYKKLGYRFSSEEEDGQVIGMMDLWNVSG